MLISQTHSDLLDYDLAQMHILFLEIDGKRGWRLPTIVEWEANSEFPSTAWFQKSTLEERIKIAEKYGSDCSRIQA